jgi:hypothetical protein
MRYITFMSLVFLFCCKNSGDIQTLEPKTSFDWLIGGWKRSNDKVGQVTFENWSKTNDSLYTGISFTLQGTDTIFSEKVNLLKKGDHWSYDVALPEASLPFSFGLTQITDSSFICENPTNDFPKMISYQIRGDSLFATISGGGQLVHYWFGKVKN